MGAILTGLLTTVLGAACLALTRYWWRETTLGQATYSFLSRTVPLKIRRRRDLLVEGWPATSKYLLHWLKRDQSRSGIHEGEFGFYADLREESVFNPRVFHLASKPRLYLTGWPCFVLYELHIGTKEVERAIAAMERQLTNGALRARSTGPVHPEADETITSFRHTIRAAQIIHRIQPRHPLVVDVLGQMLDPQSPWQLEEGGWPQFENDSHSDLWATAYAVAFLNRVLSVNEPKLLHGDTLVETALTRGINFLEAEWRRGAWCYASASSAQNGIQILHEVCDTIRSKRKELFEEATEWAGGWVTETGTVSTAYLRQCQAVSLASASARIGYALFLADSTDSCWQTLFETSLRHHEEQLNSADVAFLLHMAQHYFAGKTPPRGLPATA